MVHIYDPIPGETEVLRIRHVILLEIIIFFKLFMRSIIPFIIMLGVVLMFDHGKFHDPFLRISLSIYFLYLCIVILVTFVEWYNDVLDIFVVTDQRLIIFSQLSFFKRQVSFAYIDQVQEVRGVMSGFLQNMLRFGSIEIETAGFTTYFRMADIADPEFVVSIINKLIEKRRQYKRKNASGEPVTRAIEKPLLFNELLRVTRGRLAELLR